MNNRQNADKNFLIALVKIRAKDKDNTEIIPMHITFAIASYQPYTPTTQWPMLLYNQEIRFEIRKSFIKMINFHKLPILVHLPTCFTQKCFGAFIIACLLSASPVLGQEKVTGIVTTSTGTPLSGATINVINTSITATAISDGSFTINAKPGSTLVVSYVGYRSRILKIGSEPSVKISLYESVISLDEVVVTGYTAQKVKEITGSVAIVKPKDLTAIPAGQVEQMLQGRVAGLNVITSGQPGSASNVRLHGIGNFGDVTPLYIIDGIEGNINSLNPYDIETLQVLKDAGAYAIYGVRGANGVIVITTRKGKSRQSSINFSLYTGWQTPLKEGLDILNPQEMADLEWLAFKNSGQTPFSSLYGNGATPVLPDYQIAGRGYFEGDPFVDSNSYLLDVPFHQITGFNKNGTDWFHEVFKPAFSQNYTLSVSGGNDKNHYLCSVGYLDQQGTYVNSYLKRFTVRVNTDYMIKDVIKFGENMQFGYFNNPQPNSSSTLWQPLINAPGYLPVYDIKGNWSSLGYPRSGPTTDNPLAQRELGKDDRNDKWEIFGNLFAEVKFLKNFKARTSFGGNLDYFYSYKYSFGSYDHTAPSTLNENSGYLSSWTWNNTIDFDKSWNKHHLQALAGIEEIKKYNRGQGGSSSGFFTDLPNYRFLPNGINSQTNYSAATSTFLHSFISQADYSFNDKYYFRATLRRDGSSVFGPQERFGWFPSFGAAWRITEEKFLNNIKWLNELKIRASWGKTGFYGNTDPLNQYTLYGGAPGDAFYDVFGTSNNIVQGFRTVRIGNPRTGWQEDIVANIGFETILWNGKLNITADYYQKKSKGLLFQISLPDILGTATRPNGNIGNVENKGLDLLINSKGNFSKDWGWDITTTFTTYKNKIIKLNDLPYFDVSLPFVGMVRNQVGHPMGSFYGFKIIGFFEDSADVNNSPAQQDAKPGRFKYLDANHDKKIDQNDRAFIGNPNPDFTIGLNIGINFMNFDFSTFFYGSFGNDVFNALRMVTDIFPPGLNNPGTSPKSKTALYDSWTPQHKIATAPVVEEEKNFSNIGAPNSYAIESGSYFRNKSLMIGYTFLGSWLQKIKIDHLRVYAQVINLFTITKYNGLDPELAGSTDWTSYSKAWGFDPGNYPNNQQQYLIGLSMNF
jgi:TonB-linked SusC/RagA family outer membrane protein